MIYINRKLTEEETRAMFVNREHSRCQAAYNSDGCITLRSYDPSKTNGDELLVLSPAETEALVHLFSQLGNMVRNNTLPF